MKDWVEASIRVALEERVDQWEDPSACVCQSTVMPLGLGTSGPSTSLLLFEWPDSIKSIKTFVQ